MGKFSFIDKIFGNNTTPKPEVEPNVDPTSTPKADDTKTTVEPTPTVEPTATPTPAVEPKSAVKPALDDMFTVDTSAEQDEPKQDEPKAEPVDEPKQDEPKQDEAADTADIADAVDAVTDEPTDATDTDPVDAIKEDVKPIDLDNPARRVVTSVADESGYVVGFSIQGRSHISAGTPCEDYHAYKEIAPGWKLFITSDGAGSARESSRGSKANCEMAEKFIIQLLNAKGWIEKNYMPTELEWYIECYNIFLAMKKLQLNPEVSTICFRTPLDEEEEMSLYRYFKNVEQI